MSGMQSVSFARILRWVHVRFEVYLSLDNEQDKAIRICALFFQKSCTFCNSKSRMKLLLTNTLNRPYICIVINLGIISILDRWIIVCIYLVWLRVHTKVSTGWFQRKIFNQKTTTNSCSFWKPSLVSKYVSKYSRILNIPLSLGLEKMYEGKKSTSSFLLLTYGFSGLCADSKPRT